MKFYKRHEQCSRRFLSAPKYRTSPQISEDGAHRRGACPPSGPIGSNMRPRDCGGVFAGYEMPIHSPRAGGVYFPPENCNDYCISAGELLCVFSAVMIIVFSVGYSAVMIIVI